MVFEVCKACSIHWPQYRIQCQEPTFSGSKWALLGHLHGCRCLPPVILRSGNLPRLVIVLEATTGAGGEAKIFKLTTVGVLDRVDTLLVETIFGVGGHFPHQNQALNKTRTMESYQIR